MHQAKVFNYYSEHLVSIQDALEYFRYPIAIIAASEVY